jgi:hypothetical protein
VHTGIIEPDTRPGQNHDDDTLSWFRTAGTSMLL